MFCEFLFLVSLNYLYRNVKLVSPFEVHHSNLPFGLLRIRPLELMNVDGVLDHVDLEVRHGRFNVPKRFEPISDTGSKSNPHYKGLAYVPITERDVDQMILLEFMGAEPTVIIKI